MTKIAKEVRLNENWGGFLSLLNNPALKRRKQGLWIQGEKYKVSPTPKC